MIEGRGRELPYDDDPIEGMLRDPDAQAALTELRKDGLDLSGHAASRLRLKLIVFAFCEPGRRLSRDLVWSIQREVMWATGKPHNNEITHLLSVVRRAAGQCEYEIDADVLKQRSYRRRVRSALGRSKRNLNTPTNGLSPKNSLSFDRYH